MLAISEEVRPILADEAKTAQFLASRGEVLTREAMTAFLDCILDHFITACDLLERRARGDYAPDARVNTFPVFDRKKPKATSAQTGMMLFAAYIPAAQLSDGSVRRRRPVFKVLDERLDGRAVDSLSEDEAQKWIATLVTKKRKAFTVMNTYVAALRTVCSSAVHRGLISANPFVKARVKVPENQKPRSRPPGRETKAFTAKK